VVAGPEIGLFDNHRHGTHAGLGGRNWLFRGRSARG
jgi:hypothetical protein